MAAIAEQQKLKNIDMEKQLQALGLSSALHLIPSQVHDLQQALQERDGQDFCKYTLTRQVYFNLYLFLLCLKVLPFLFRHTSIIEQLKITLQNQEGAVHQKNSADPIADAPSADSVRQLSALVAKKDQELEV